MFVEGKYIYTVEIQGQDYDLQEWDIWIFSSEVHLTPEQAHAAFLFRHTQLLVDYGFTDEDGNVDPTTEIRVHETNVMEL